MEAAVSPCTLSDLTNLVYPDLHTDLIPGAQQNLLTHLQKLEEENRISEPQSHLCTHYSCTALSPQEN